MARPTKLTRPLLARFCEELRKGKPKRAAAAAVGVHRDTAAQWERAGKQARGKQLENVPLTVNEKLYLLALDEIQVAYDEGESYLFDVILAGGKDWQRAARILESTRKDVWLRTTRPIELPGGGGGTIEVRLSFDLGDSPDRSLAEQ